MEKPKRLKFRRLYGVKANFNTFEAVRDLYDRVLLGNIVRKCFNVFAKAYYGYEWHRNIGIRPMRLLRGLTLDCKEVFLGKLTFVDGEPFKKTVFRLELGVG